MTVDETKETRLPPGQVLTRKFPVVGEKAPSGVALDLAKWRLRVHGLVQRPFTWTWSDLKVLADEQLTVDIHCVTGWSRFDNTFTGLPLKVILDYVGVMPEAKFVRFEAYSGRRHDTSLPLDVALEDTWLVHSLDGKPLTPEHGFPLRVLNPNRYFYKSLKWLHRIELLAEDRLGFWERESAYHNVGDPWAGDQRFTTGSLRPEQALQFREATSFERWRGPRRVMIGLDLEGWQPASRDLRGLHLKNCNLRGADLEGCDLSEANLSVSDLSGANLRGANLKAADLEGTSFLDADLSDADLRDSLLVAARFVNAEGLRGARVQGSRWRGSSGLLGSQERYLLEVGGLSDL